MLGAQAWDEKLHGQPLTGEDVAGLLEIATDSYRFDMLQPDEIVVLCGRISAVSDDYGSCAHCGEPAQTYVGATIYECVNCQTRWCEKCELVRLETRACLFCGKDFMRDDAWQGD